VVSLQRQVSWLTYQQQSQTFPDIVYPVVFAVIIFMFTVAGAATDLTENSVPPYSLLMLSITLNNLLRAQFIVLRYQLSTSDLANEQ